MTNSGECTPTYPFDRSTFCIYFSRHWDQAQCQFNGSNGGHDIQSLLVTSALYANLGWIGADCFLDLTGHLIVHWYGEKQMVSDTGDFRQGSHDS